MKNLIILSFLVCCTHYGFSQAVVEGTVLIDWVDPPANVIMPDEVLTIKAKVFEGKRIISVDLKNVKIIESGAFRNCSSLNTVQMPNVEVINARAMENTNVKSISMPKVKVIGPFSFSNATALNSVELPSVERIERGAFNGCNALTTVDLRNAVNLKRIGTPENPDQSPFPNRKKLTIIVAEGKIGLFPAPEMRNYTVK